jgi:hypothetical protein
MYRVQYLGFFVNAELKRDTAPVPRKVSEPRVVPGTSGVGQPLSLLQTHATVAV